MHHINNPDEPTSLAVTWRYVMQADRLIKTQYTSICIFSTDRSKWLNLAFTILCLEHCKERNPLHLFTFLYSLLVFFTHLFLLRKQTSPRLWLTILIKLVTVFCLHFSHPGSHISE